MLLQVNHKLPTMLPPSAVQGPGAPGADQACGGLEEERHCCCHHERCRGPVSWQLLSPPGGAPLQRRRRYSRAATAGPAAGQPATPLALTLHTPCVFSPPRTLTLRSSPFHFVAAASAAPCCHAYPSPLVAVLPLRRSVMLLCRSVLPLCRLVVSLGSAVVLPAPSLLPLAAKQTGKCLSCSPGGPFGLALPLL